MFYMIFYYICHQHLSFLISCFFCYVFILYTILASEKRKTSLGGCKAVLWSLFSFTPPPAARRPGGATVYRLDLITSKQKNIRDGVSQKGGRQQSRGSGGRQAQDASSGRRPRATVKHCYNSGQARENCNKNKKYPKSNNPHHVRDRCICSYHVRYRTVHCKIPYSILPIINTADPTIMKFKDQ